MHWTNILIDLLLAVYVLDCVFMGLVILMQRSKQEGLGAAFGGGFTESVFGAQTSNVLVKATVWAAILFFVLSITLARLYAHLDSVALQNQSPVQQLLSQPVAPAVKPTAPATPTNPSTTPASTTTTPASSATTTPAAPAVTPTVPAPVSPTTGKPATTPSK
jgi:preprotein translocase subunit SecG